MKKIILLILILVLMPNNIYANEIMQARVTAHYKHPVTGVIEDPGNNFELGQGMTQTVIDSKSMVEMQNGKLYATVRLNLANHISNVSLGTQEKGQGSFNPVSYEVIDKSEETMDIKFAIPSKTAIVRAAFFVQPMGRDVIFFFDFSNFKTISNTNENEKVQENQQNEVVRENQNVNQNTNIQTTVDETPMQIAENTQNTVNNEQNIAQNSDITEITINLQDEISKQTKEIKDKDDELSKDNEKAQALSAENIGYSHGLLMKGSQQLDNYYSLQDDSKEKGDVKENLQEQENVQTPEMGEFTKFMIKITIGFVFAIALILFIIAMIMIIVAKVLRQINLREEEKLYD